MTQPAPVPLDQWPCETCKLWRKGKPKNMGVDFIHTGHWCCGECIVIYFRLGLPPKKEKQLASTA